MDIAVRERLVPVYRDCLKIRIRVDRAALVGGGLVGGVVLHFLILVAHCCIPI